MTEQKKGTDIPQAEGTPPAVEKSDIAKREEEVLAFWKKESIFKKTLEKPAPRGDFVFYDGPPFATGLPHHGHILAGTIKDAIPRYRTMRGFRVPRRWGWDCHGLPLENIIEQEQGIRNKREIEERGIGTFVEAARSAVLRYADDWRRIIPRMGRFVDMEDDYKTMDTTYTESVWWSFKTLFDKGLIYEGFKTMHLCPRCGTTLANFEVAQGYKDIEDISVYVKFPLEGEENTSLLVWTTTPWTLPGNTAAAVHKDATYVKVEHGGEYLVLAKDRLDVVPGTPTIVAEFLGKELIGKRYEPPFPYFKGKDIKGKAKAWRIYHAPYVSMEDGAGAVHLAPAFGEEDKQLADREGIPLIHHVSLDGRMTEDVTDFAGLPAKPKGRHMETDGKIVEALSHSGRLFKRETLTHSYPHCWRCDSPLLNYAASSWFVKVSALKGKIAAENKKIPWVPSYIGAKRFQNLIETAPDWAISRARYWGAPIPIWRNEKTGAVRAIGSIDELLSSVKRSGNRYIVMRHGEAKSNVENIVDSGNMKDNHLTEAGKESVASALNALKARGIDLIVASPLMRAQETAKMALRGLGLPESALMTDERLREIDFGGYEGSSREAWVNRFATYANRYAEEADGAETMKEVRARVGDFLFEIERRYAGKTILIVTHAEPAWLMQKVAACISCKEFARADKPYRDQSAYLGNAEFHDLPFAPYPHNKDFELDLHRPYIDEITWGGPLEGAWKRVGDVFDCWYESGSMPYASNHYPFRKDRFDPKRLLGLSPKGYPADFISESVDQTRGWFYSLIVLGVALFGRSPYKHVITNGLVLAQDGKKMSKKLKNYTDPLLIVDRYGADALRYYLLSSALIRGEDLNFTDRGVDEVGKKLITRLENVRTFLKLYDDGTAGSADSPALLDRWIRARLNELVAQSTAGYEAYELDVATKPLSDFIDDLSTWYLRRSRDRFKQNSQDVSSTALRGPEVSSAAANSASASSSSSPRLASDAHPVSSEGDGRAARATLRHALIELSKVMAPVMPFYADYLYRSLRSDEAEPISVHLCDWPEAGAIDEEVLASMRSVREIVSLGLEARAKANIKVRQPLASLTCHSAAPLGEEYLALVRDEVNVKSVVVAPEEGELSLDLRLTPELRAEGLFRDLARAVQALRKEQGLTVSDRPALRVATNEEGEAFVRSVKEKLMKDTGLSAITFSAAEAAEPQKDLPFPIELSLSTAN